MPDNTQRPVIQLLSQYSESHLNPTNEVIHFICVPAIVFSLLGVIWAIHPLAALATAVISLVYYFTLSAPIAWGMLLMSSVMLAVLYAVPQQNVLLVSGVVFVVAWVGQFIGHKIEGKKPSFLDDLRFLMIGPLFVLGFLYRRLRIAY
jgi:uncharacterized membrane protein YGL010W